MQLWFSRAGDVPIREQLVTQVVLGILSGDLAPGECLPSTRELARRFHVHSNTISAGYRQLERDGWVESRRGSGVYVRRNRPTRALSPELAIDQAIAHLFQSAGKLGLPRSVLRARLNRWLAAQPPDHFLVIEPDEDLRQIVIAEIRQVVTFPLSGCSIDDCSGEGGGRDLLDGAIAVVLPSKAEAVRKTLPAETELITLQVRSIHSSLASYLPAPADSLVGVASYWADFLTLAHTMLIAAGFHPDSLVLRNCAETGWRAGLDSVAAVVCDSVIAAELPKKPPVICFALLSEDSLAELRRCEQLILSADWSSPLPSP